MTIIQPRAHHEDGPVRSWDITWEELQLFAKELVAAGQEASREDAPLVTGEKQCRWCRASATCPALADMTQEVTENKFAVVVAAAEEEGGDTPFPAAGSLTIKQVAKVVRAAPLIKQFLEDATKFATETLNQGGEVPGFKLIEGRRSRKWNDEEKAKNYLTRKLGGRKNAVIEKVISPAQAEKKFKAGGVGTVPKHMLSFVSWVAGSPKLAREENPKPALLVGNAENMFTAVEEN